MAVTDWCWASDHSRVQRKSPNAIPQCAHRQLHGVSKGPPALSQVGRDGNLPGGELMGESA